MKRLLATLALLPLLGTSLLACSDDCQRLASITCERAGEASDECKRIQEQASAATSEDKQACALALRVVDEFIGNR